MDARGFTLIELMVVLLIASLLLAAGVPALQQAAAEQRLVAAANQFFHGVSLARAQALRHARRAEMRPSDGLHWERGWQIEVGQRVLRREPALPTGISVAHTAGGEVLGYQPNGQPLTRGSWHFSSDGRSRVVVINFLGRARVCNPARETQCSKAELD